MFSDFVDLIFPQYCLACLGYLEKGEVHLCTTCHYSLPKTDAQGLQSSILAQKFWGKVDIIHALAYLKFTKEGRVQRLLHQLKYSGHQEIGELLGRWYGYDLKESGYTKEFDLIVPVPLHKSKLKKRGYNQSDCVAKGLSEGLGVPWSADILVRAVATETQTKKKRLERWANVDNIFVINDTETVQQKHILLVDDVITTGATLEACAHQLYESGSKAVSIAAIAMAS